MGQVVSEVDVSAEMTQARLSLSVWPDVGIKIIPNFLNNAHSSFYIQSNAFHSSLENCKIFGPFCKNKCSQELSKIAQSGHYPKSVVFHYFWKMKINQKRPFLLIILSHWVKAESIGTTLPTKMCTINLQKIAIVGTVVPKLKLNWGQSKFESVLSRKVKIQLFTLWGKRRFYFHWLWWS